MEFSSKELKFVKILFFWQKKYFSRKKKNIFNFENLKRARKHLQAYL